MRRIFQAAILATTLTALATTAFADEWPAGKAVQITVPAPGGAGTGDTIARVVGEELAKRLKSPVVIDNRPGANGNIGAAAVAKEAADGYRLLFSWAGTLAVNPSLYRNMGFDPQTSFAPIVLVADVPNILVVSDSLPVKDLADFVKYAKANPDKLNYGTTGQGSSMHLAAELFMRETGTKMMHIPYNAPSAATGSLMANDIQVMFQLIPGIAGQVRAKKVHALAIMSPVRSPALPDVPTTTELGMPKLQSSTWFALLAPKGTPPAILDRINAEVNEILKDPAVRERLAKMGASPLGGTRQDLAKHLAAETTKWGNVVRESKIQLQ